VPFEITADLPAGTFNVDADLTTSIHYQVYGDGQEVIVKDARLLFTDSLTFEIEVPDGVVATSGSGLLPILGGAQPEPPALSVADATVTEGSSGTTAVDLTVTRSDGSGTSTVQYATVDGTATAGADYTATSGSVTFAAGETAKSVSVPVTGDTIDEPDETFGLELTAPTGATVADGSATVTITDDDEPAPLTPAERLRDLRAQLDSMDLPKGLATSLGAKLDAALAALERGRVEAACGSLTAFGNQVAASSPERLAGEAARLVTVEAAAIRDALGCG
jgi:chitinase